ncbi:MAG: 50S ribosomal protein L25 [Candidatus Eremiobacteraeota bacterium]|nr:50S ribosomal protein L25 [Candidatus Eremiobacteraeota bacterium]
MAHELKLSIEAREGTGTTSARRLRAAGKVPAVLYGHGTDPRHVALDARAFEDVLHHGGRTSLITLTTGKKAETALLRELQRHPVSRKIEHADLQLVSANESVHSRLPVVTVGTPIGVRELGGVMDVISHELEIEGPANKLPDNLEIDVTELGLHDHVVASQVKLPDGFKMITPPDTLVVAIEPSKTAQAVEDAAVAPALEQAEP